MLQFTCKNGSRSQEQGHKHSHGPCCHTASPAAPPPSSCQPPRPPCPLPHRPPSHSLSRPQQLQICSKILRHGKINLCEWPPITYDTTRSMEKQRNRQPLEGSALCCTEFPLSRADLRRVDAGSVGVAAIRRLERRSGVMLTTRGLCFR